MSLDKFKTIIFDCDGVLLNSNKIKTKAFYDTVVHYGKAPAKKLVEYHIHNGGISRFKKFEYFFSKIIKINPNESIFKGLLDAYSLRVKTLLKTCEVAQGLFELREYTKNADWMIVSGSLQDELRDYFKYKKLNNLFNLGIYGSPNTKEAIFKREIQNKNINFPALYIGDSEYDYKCALLSNIDFIFLYSWTEFSDWDNFCTKNNIEKFEKLANLIPELSLYE